ncbi:MAG: DNA-directed RNA polymerase subunit beta' [Patescibacteria group bacterium]
MDDQKQNLNFSGLKIRIASPDDIAKWSKGEVTKPETINYRTFRPEKDGLFDERIFGPTKDYECYCGKYKRIRYKGIICDRCGVEVTASVVRRERMGHIKLSTPVAHIWYFKGPNAPISTLLEIPAQMLERVIYYAAYLVTKVDNDKQKEVVAKLEAMKETEIKDVESQFEKKRADLAEDFAKQKNDLSKKITKADQLQITLSEVDLKERESQKRLSDAFVDRKAQVTATYDRVIRIVKEAAINTVFEEEDFLFLREKELDGFAEVGMGAEVLYSILEKFDLKATLEKCQALLHEVRGERRTKVLKKMRVVESFIKSNINPMWLMLSMLPVIPPDLRPVVQLSGGKFATSDLNDLYRRVINRNNRLKQLIELGAPEIILRNEKRMLQEAVDSLIDLQKSRGKARVVGSSQAKALKSLSDILRGKQGRFRQNLLGKRVDYSARSTITVGPNLGLDQCGLPKEMALEIFKPFILHEIMIRGHAPNIKAAKNFLEEKQPVVYDILESVVKDHPILLNRAPTLHKLSILGFYPVLIDDHAIRLHPTVCAGFNADFDGDAMGVFLPLSKESIDEVKNRMLAKHNLLKPADGSPIVIPNKEMALGVYYMTSMDQGYNNVKDESLAMAESRETARSLYDMGKIELRQPLFVRIEEKAIKTTVGRIMFNDLLPVELQFINDAVKAGDIKNLVTKAIKLYNDHDKVALLIDNIKSIGFWASTIAGGLSVSVFDCAIADEKQQVLDEAQSQVTEIENNFQEGLLTEDEKKRYSNKLWMETTEKLADMTWDSIDEENPVKIIIKSGGARASREQLKQLSAIKGLVVDPMGKIIEVPTKSNYREGLNIFEYVISARGARKGLTDSALKTADAGYLTRRLHDVAHDMIIREKECDTTSYLTVSRDGERGEKFGERIRGRFVAQDVAVNGETIIEKNNLITDEIAKAIGKSNVQTLDVYSPLHCACRQGLCQRCYGVDLSNGQPAEIGTPVGVTAAQSIGEPGTQLTMRVRHFGGIVISDVTQGLPRVEELFETRTPKIVSPITSISGRATVVEDNEKETYQIKITSTDNEEEEYRVPMSQKLKIKDGDLVAAGSTLSEGYLDVDDVLAIRGLADAQQYLVDEIQKVYESQGIAIHDKHFEIIVRKMSDKITIEEEGDTPLVKGEIVSRLRYEMENRKVLALGAKPATGKVIILGITRAAIYTESWLSAASFEQTTSVLSKAAIAGQTDYLLGLKENVIIGRLIPVNQNLIEDYHQKFQKTYANNQPTH